jgi:hypothetical protein
MKLLKTLVVAVALLFALPSLAQKAGKAPQNIIISDKELSVLLSARPEAAVSFPDNSYLDKAVCVKIVRNGDMQFVRLKLSSFRKAYLNVQVNGVYTTQAFILSEEGSASYKGEVKDGQLRMEKCSKEDIVVE